MLICYVSYSHRICEKEHTCVHSLDILFYNNVSTSQTSSSISHSYKRPRLRVGGGQGRKAPGGGICGLIKGRARGREKLEHGKCYYCD